MRWVLYATLHKNSLHQEYFIYGKQGSLPNTKVANTKSGPNLGCSEKKKLTITMAQNSCQLKLFREK